MSQENVEVVRGLYGAVGRRDSEGVLAFYAPDVEWHVYQSPLGELTGEAVYRGHEGVRKAFREYYDAWESIQEQYEELLDAGECVVSVVTSRARGRASGAEVERRHYGLWTVRDGKIVRVVWFSTRAEALKAAGLRE